MLHSLWFHLLGELTFRRCNVSLLFGKEVTKSSYCNSWLVGVVTGVVGLLGLC